MGLTALQTRSNVQGEGLGPASVGQYKTGEYRGATTAARFGDPQAEFAALRGGCGVFDLGFRAKIALTGSDRVRLPGERGMRRYREQLANGVALYPSILPSLARWAERFGVTAPSAL